MLISLIKNQKSENEVSRVITSSLSSDPEVIGNVEYA